MLLQNELAKNAKYAIGKETIEADAHGILEVTDKEVIEALLASGFHQVQGKKPAKEAKAPEPEKEPEAPVVDEPSDEDHDGDEDTSDAPVVDAPVKKKKKWNRGS